MADIMLVLLIIFMITIPNMQSGITITLPKSVNSVEEHKIDSPKACVVALTRELEIYIGKKPVAQGKTMGLKPEEQWAVRQQELSEQLKQKFQSSTEIDKSIFLKADTSVPYGRVVQVVNNCRSSGVDRIGLMTEKEEEKK